MITKKFLKTIDFHRLNGERFIGFSYSEGKKTTFVWMFPIGRIFYENS
jgi:hypothetical protein